MSNDVCLIREKQDLRLYDVIYYQYSKKGFAYWDGYLDVRVK